jgi:hypothetical protein
MASEDDLIARALLGLHARRDADPDALNLDPKYVCVLDDGDHTTWSGDGWLYPLTPSEYDVVMDNDKWIRANKSDADGMSAIAMYEALKRIDKLTAPLGERASGELGTIRQILEGLKLP